jgi:hypothetical protein
MAKHRGEYVWVDDPKILIQNLEGVWWHEAPKPSRWHKCWIQTVGYASFSVQRCACGAARMSRWDRWVKRNSRK